MGRGVLRPDLAASVLRLDRHKPTDALAPFVDYYWIPRWDLRGRPPHEQTVLPHPNVHLVFEASGAGIFGVDRRLFTRSLSGLGLAFGIRFTAGGFRPFWQAPISQLTDRVVPAARLFGPRAEKTRQAIMDDFTFGGLDVDDGVMIGYAEALLHSALPEPDPLAGQAAALVSCITEDPALRRVDQLSASSGLTVRTLQRLFADYVGVSPKWVMRRARLHDAAERADSGEPVDWAALASDLGYADQAHLTRDFTVTIGVPPARYAAAPLPESLRYRVAGRALARSAAGVGVCLTYLARLAGISRHDAPGPSWGEGAPAPIWRPHSRGEGAPAPIWRPHSRGEGAPAPIYRGQRHLHPVTWLRGQPARVAGGGGC
jgi:AraC-like DNA-binding protein